MSLRYEPGVWPEIFLKVLAKWWTSEKPHCADIWRGKARVLEEVLGALGVRF